MKKKSLLLLLLTLSFGYVQSQNLKTGIIYYDHIDNHYGVSYKSYLVFNENKSYFVTAKSSLGLSKNGKIADNTEGETFIEHDEFNTVTKTRKEGLQVFLDKLTDSIYFTHTFSLTSKILYAKEKKPGLNWVFEKSIKKIGSFHCKKATVNFRGRKYICWYTEKIPLPYGPWKLQGLPGIILEAKSEDGFVEFYFKKIKYPETKVSVPLNKNQLLKKGQFFISFKDYMLKQKKYIKKIDNYLKIYAKKSNMQMEPFSEKDNFLEVFGFTKY